MPGSMPATSQLDWLISTTVMIVLSWSRATRDLLKSFGWGIRALHQLATATMVPSPRRLPHTISPLEEDGFEPSVPLARVSLDSRGGEGAVGRLDRLERRHPFHGGPVVRIRLPPAGSLRTIGPLRDERPDWASVTRRSSVRPRRWPTI